MKDPKLWLVTLAAALAACSSKSSSNPDASTTGADAPADANMISGTVNGTGFTAVMATYWIGSPDSPATDTVIYMFDRNIACNQITTAGWDTAIPSGTQILEMKMVGKTPSTY